MESKAEGWRKKVNAFHKVHAEDYSKPFRYQRPEGFYEEFAEPSEESCLTLWRAVLYYSFHESFIRADKEIFKARARYWFTDHKEDFHTVCEYSGLDPSYVRGMFDNKMRKFKPKDRR